MANKPVLPSDKLLFGTQPITMDTKMPYYHVRVKKNNSQWVFAFDLPKEKVEEEILLPFKKQETFMYKSAVIRYSEIDRFGVFETEIPSSEILNKTKAKRIVKNLMGTKEEPYLVNAKEIFSHGKDVTEELLKGLSVNSHTSAQLESPVNNGQKSDEKQVLSVQDNKQPLIRIDDQTEHARSLLYELENTLRQFVSSKIAINNCEIDEDFVKSWESTKKKEFLPPRKPLETPLINYSSFEQLRRIITQNNNWEKIFKSHFGRQNGVISRINEIDEIRDTIAHNRILSDFDYKSFITFYNELMGCIENSSLRQVNAFVNQVAEKPFLEEASSEDRNQKIMLLQDGDDITKLQITNKLLDNIFDRAHEEVKKYFLMPSYLLSL